VSCLFCDLLDRVLRTRDGTASIDDGENCGEIEVKAWLLQSRRLSQPLYVRLAHRDTIQADDQLWHIITPSSKL
jgi:hypothetical protein